MNSLKVKILNENGRLPFKKNSSDAGYDLISSEDITVIKDKVTVISTGIAVKIPDGDDEVGFYGRIAPRSGLAVKHGINVFAGVIDSGYTGEIKVALHNVGIDEYQVKKGDRIAQLIITPILKPKLEQVDSLEDTSRGDKGFGSSGK